MDVWVIGGQMLFGFGLKLKKKNQPKVGFLFGRTEGEAIKNSLETLKN